MKKLLRLFFVTFLIVNISVSAQGKVDYKKLDEYISKAVIENNLPGLAIGIVKNDSVTFSKAYGTKNTFDLRLVQGIYLLFFI